MTPIYKPIYAIYTAGYTDYDGLDTWRAMPTNNLPIDALEPFLFLNHHGPQVFPANNRGLPFGPHPHKGFETVTFILTGDLVHRDSTGFNSNIRAGGIQWMTAGSGIIHSETSSTTFQEKGGPVELLQLWVNLPGRLKQTKPAYIGLQQPEVPQLKLDEGKVQVNMVSGTWHGQQAPIQSLADVHLATVNIAANGNWSVEVPENNEVLFYIIRGKLSVNGSEVETHDLVKFEPEGNLINVVASEDAMLLVGHAQPQKEPIVAHGPFVMNTQEEIRQAFVGYQQGAFGVWQD